ncbi:hypothetical protein [Vibrio parahaemolyticus]|uniref:hypothetical protein n=1 Tax=Vibrio parahaemolyticus TaxID=670 RepID=UPI0011102176|nr:hypothetical protein [Vibrio parahaemolyticus]TMX35020.1 hypothetical protein DA098_21305 [Vibrio parahaemolyticus]TMX78298.1 hypothetical protein DA094_11285 [Vibrio parahaemolyticus]
MSNINEVEEYEFDDEINQDSNLDNSDLPLEEELDLDDVDLELDEEEIPENEMVLGSAEESPEMALDNQAKPKVDDSIEVVSELEDDLDFSNKNQEEIQKTLHKFNSREEELEAKKDEYLKSFDMRDNFLYKDGQKVIELKKSKFNRAVKQAYLGASPKPDAIVAGLMLVPDKHIAKFPHSEENVLNFKTALIEIRDNDLFDLDDITIANGVHEDFRKALEEVKNDQLKLGRDNKLDKPKPKPEQSNDQDKPKPEYKAEFGQTEPDLEEAQKNHKKISNALEDTRADALQDFQQTLASEEEKDKQRQEQSQNLGSRQKKKHGSSLKR